MLIPVRILLLTVYYFASISLISEKKPDDADIKRLWFDCSLDGEISFEIFNTAILGYRQIENINKKNIITIIDFSKPSTERRFFVVDIQNKKLLYKCFVAHGKNSGGNNAESFSDKAQSLKSSLGFFLTAETYSGKHGYSLKLDGLEESFNRNAREREIVIHGADYVSEEFIKKYGRLGRSHGCLAIPVEISKELIDRISDGSCLFIYGDDDDYKKKSVFVSRLTPKLTPF